MRAAFQTRQSGGEPGLLVEEYDNPELRGPPVATRVEWTIARGNPEFLGDPDSAQLRDSLPRERMRARRAARDRNDEKRRYERWRGWYTPDRAGDHTLFAQDGGGYRVWLDGELLIDNARVPQAMLRQAHRALSAAPHELVFEEAPGGESRQPFFRVGLFRDDEVIDPLALQLAARADAVVLGVGFDHEIETEASDREFALPPGQDRLIRAVAAQNRSVTVVLTSGGSVDVSPWLDDVEAVVAAWFPGQEGGAALAQLLLGDANFSGRLPISWERRLAENPSIQSYHFNDPAQPERVVYREGLFTGYRGFQARAGRPLFSFGFGLSYTTFRYSNLRVAPAASGAPRSRRPALFELSFDVTNTGRRAGADVPQLYVAPGATSLPRPKRELKAFSRVELGPGETRRVRWTLDARAFAHYDPTRKLWRADAGTYGLELARSADGVEVRSEVTLPSALDLRVED
jgi:beta-glucosidase